jgi:hypothetical protein
MLKIWDVEWGAWVEGGSVVGMAMGVGVEDGIDVSNGMDVAGGAGGVTGVRAGVCVDSGVCAIWDVPVWVFKVWGIKLGHSGRVVVWVFGFSFLMEQASCHVKVIHKGREDMKHILHAGIIVSFQPT